MVEDGMGHFLSLSFEIPACKLNKLTEILATEKELDHYLVNIHITQGTRGIFTVNIGYARADLVRKLTELKMPETTPEPKQVKINIASIKTYHYTELAYHYTELEESQVKDKVLGKVIKILQCDECPIYQKYGNIKLNRPDFCCTVLNKIVDPFTIDPDYPLEDMKVSQYYQK